MSKSTRIRWAGPAFYPSRYSVPQQGYPLPYLAATRPQGFEYGGMFSKAAAGYKNWWDWYQGNLPEDQQAALDKYVEEKGMDTVLLESWQSGTEEVGDETEELLREAAGLDPEEDDGWQVGKLVLGVTVIAVSAALVYRRL